MRTGKVFRVAAVLLLLVGMASMGAAELKEFDGFEDGDYTSNPAWTEVASNGAATVQQGTVKNGDDALKIQTQDAGEHILSHDRSSDDQINDGDVYQAWMRIDNVDDEIGGFYLTNDPGEPFDWSSSTIFIRFNRPNIQFQSTDSNGNSITASNIYSASSDTWYRFEIEFDTDNDEATGRVYDVDGNELGSSTISTSGMSYNLQYAEVQLRDIASGDVSFFADDVSYSTDPANSAPVFDSTSVTPDPPLIGESVSYEANTSDSDGDVVELNLTVYDDGTEVYHDSVSGSSSTLNNTWSDIYTATEGDLDAFFTATDDAGATTTEWLNRTLEDLAPNVNVQDPGNTTYWKYDVPWQVAVSDSDSNPDESITCDLYNDTAQFDSFTAKEGNTASGTFRASLGQHTFNASCKDPAGNTNSSTVDFTVDNYEFQSQSSPSSTYETENTTYTGSWKLGSMVDDLDTELYWNDTPRDTNRHEGTGIRTTTLDHYFQPPLVQTNTTTEQWTLQYDVNYTEEDGTRTSDVVNTTVQNQDVLWSYWLENSGLVDNDLIEGEHYDFNLTINALYPDRSTYDATETYHRTGNTEPLVQSSNTSSTITWIQGQPVGNLTGLSNQEKFNVSGEVDVSFKGTSRSITTPNSTVDVYKTLFTDCSGGSPSQEVALEFNTYRENETSTSQTSDMDAAFQAWKNPDVKRSFNFSSTGTSTHQFCIYPSWAEYTVDSTEKLIQYNADNYQKRNYHLIQETADNSTLTVPLYLVPSATSQNVDFEVEGADGTPAEQTVIQVERYFPSKDKYLVVAMPRTGGNGEASTYLETDQVQYRFKLYQDGELVHEEPDTEVPSDNEIFIQIGKDFDPSLYTWKDQVGSSCTSGTTYVNCSYTSDTGNLEKVTLNVDKRQAIGFKSVCSRSGGTVSGRLICTSLNTTGNRYKYVLEAEMSGGSFNLETGWLGNVNNRFGDAGLMVAFMLFITLSMGGLWRPEASVLLGLLALTVSFFTGFLALSLSAFASIVFVGLILVWRMNQSGGGTV